MKNKLTTFAGLVVLALADLGSGILNAVVLGAMFGVLARSFTFVFLFVWCGLWSELPDIDFVLKRVLGLPPEYSHRNLLHKPLPILTVMLFITLYVTRYWSVWTIWPLTATVSVLAHFVHDSLGNSNWPGIKWLSPLREDQYLFFAHFTGWDSGREMWRLLWVYDVRDQLLSKPRRFKEMVKSSLTPTYDTVGSVAWFLLSLVALTIFWLR